jgi:hypothetical protein
VEHGGDGRYAVVGEEKRGQTALEGEVGECGDGIVGEVDGVVLVLDDSLILLLLFFLRELYHALLLHQGFR